MSTYDDYLTHDDKPYAENINDALLLSNVFDLTVPIELPTMFKNGYFNTSISPRKAGVSIITYVSKSSDNVSVTNTSISGTGDIIFKFYPNFNSYGTISSLDWTATGTVTVDIEGADGEDILTGHTGGTITGATTGLTELQEFTLTFHLTSASISTINFVMENKDGDRYGAECGISDVTGLQTSLDGKSNVGHTHVADDITNLKTALLDLIYPVGSIYMSIISTSPATLFGGQWVSIGGRFLIGADNTYTGGSTGGEAQHTLTVNEIPSHTHTQEYHNHTQDYHNHTQDYHNHTQNEHTHTQAAHRHSLGTYWSTPSSATTGAGYMTTADRKLATHYTENATPTINAKTATNQQTRATNQQTRAVNQQTKAVNNNTGGGQAHNNMPPYLVVYMWKRTG